MALLLPRRKAGAVDISEVFSTDLYSGTGADITITNGIDLSGEGGLVWIKARDDNANHGLYDTERGPLKVIRSDTTAAQQTASAGREVYQFNSDGFIVGNEFNLNVNRSGNTYASWTFRKSPNFFDVVTYTGNGTAGRTISHNLGVTPGMIVVKSTSAASNWIVHHRSRGFTQVGILNSTSAFVADPLFTASSDTDFTISSGSLNNNGVSYVAYLFAHDTTDNGVIQCGSYTGNGSSSGPTITLGWEPQWVMIKNATATGGWILLDEERGFGNPDPYLQANGSFAEQATLNIISVGSTGFQIVHDGGGWNSSGQTYIYIAIRKEGV